MKKMNLKELDNIFLLRRYDYLIKGCSYVSDQGVRFRLLLTARYLHLS